MARYSVGGYDDGNGYGTASRSRCPLPKRSRADGPIPTLRPRNVPPSTSNSAFRRAPDRPIAEEEEEEEEEEESSYESQGEWDTSDSGPESEQERGRSPRYSPSPFSGEEEVEEEEEYVEEDEVQRGNGNSNQSRTEVMLTDPGVLDCPICLGPLSIPVYQCGNGHFVCGKCSIKTRNICPVCSMPIRFSNCRGIEKVLVTVKTSCQNMQLGCTEKISYGIRRVHEKYCKYAPCSCPIPDCNYVNMYTCLYKHFALRHVNASIEFSFNATKLILLGKNENQVFLQERNESVIFVLNRIFVPLGSLVNVICVAPYYSCATYTCELTASGGRNKIMLKSCVEVTPKWIAAQSPKKNCLVITNDFGNISAELKLELIIRKEV